MKARVLPTWTSHRRCELLLKATLPYPMTVTGISALPLPGKLQAERLPELSLQVAASPPPVPLCLPSFSSILCTAHKARGSRRGWGCEDTKASPDTAKGFWAVVLTRAGTEPRHKADTEFMKEGSAQWLNSAGGKTGALRKENAGSAEYQGDEARCENKQNLGLRVPKA